MINALLILTVTLLYTMQSFLCKKYSDSYPGKDDDSSSVFTVVSGVTVALVCLILMRFDFDASATTVWLGLLNAAALIGYNFFIVKCAQTGPYSVLMVFSLSGGILIPTFISTVIFKDAISPLKLVGIALVILSVYLMSVKKGEEGIKSRLFLPSCIALAVCNGLYCALFDVQQRLTGVDGVTTEKEEMIAITYATAALVTFITLSFKNKRATIGAFKQTGKSLAFLLSCSVVVATAVNLLVYILQYVDTAILYTFDNSGVLLLSVLLSCIFMHEKLSVKNAVGCALMCGSLVLVAVA